MRRGRAIVLVLTASGLVGCPLPNGTGPSPIADAARVTLSGNMLDLDGAPYVGPVTLRKEAPEATDREAGTAELSTQSDAQGRFSFSLVGATTKNTYGEAHFYHLEVSRPSGQKIDRRLQFNAPTLALGAMRLWRGLIEPVAVPGGIRLAWSVPAMGPSAYHVSLADREGRPIWFATRDRAGWEAPQYLFEPGAAYRWSVEAVGGPYSVRSDYGVFSSAQDATKRVWPIIEATNEKGVRYPGLHDGKLGEGAYRGGAPIDNEVEEVVLDLGEPRVLAQVVLYGATKGVSLYTATERGEWGPVRGEADGGDVDWDLGGTSARYVRLHRPGGAAFFSQMREVRAVGPAS